MKLSPKLLEPIDPNRVKTREGGGGRRLSYVEAHDAIRTANAIFGFGEWGYSTLSLDMLGTEKVSRDGREGFRVGYRAVVQVTVEGCPAFSDVGYGDALEYTGSVITPHELAAKEAVSDALKRALKNYGDQFGLGLYDKDAPAVGTATHREHAPQRSAQADGEFRFRAGKHKGKSLSEVPGPYLDWVLDNFKEDDDYSVQALDAIRAFRGLEAPVSIPTTDDEIPF